MKTIYTYTICLCLFLATLCPVNAAQKKTILIYSDTLSVILLLTPQGDHSAELLTIPSNTILPIQCAKQTPASLSTITNFSMQDCMEESISTSLSIPITNYIYLYGDRIDAEFSSSLSMRDIQNFDQLYHYFSLLGEQVQISTLWKLPDVIETDLSLFDFYDLYQFYRHEDFSIHYRYLHLLQYGSHWYALDKQSYPIS